MEEIFKELANKTYGTHYIRTIFERFDMGIQHNLVSNRLIFTLENLSKTRYDSDYIQRIEYPYPYKEMIISSTLFTEEKRILEVDYIKIEEIIKDVYYLFNDKN